ncbi:MAG: hypothetical protein KDH89_10555 [Anaerolineae bacterium]|nr:hypothetical protein [Anaerolineae bacterium]
MGSAIVSATGAHWEEDRPDRMTMNTDTRSTALALDVLARLDPDALTGIAPNAVRWLMKGRRLVNHPGERLVDHRADRLDAEDR